MNFAVTTADPHEKIFPVTCGGIFFATFDRRRREKNFPHAEFFCYNQRTNYIEKISEEY